MASVKYVQSLIVLLVLLHQVVIYALHVILYYIKYLTKKSYFFKIVLKK